MMKELHIPLWVAVLVFLVGCGVESDKTASFQHEPGSLDTLRIMVGDASNPLQYTRVTFDSRGRTITERNYDFLAIEVEDTTVAVLSGMQVVGKSPGVTRVVARDRKTTLKDFLPLVVSEASAL